MSAKPRKALSAMYPPRYYCDECGEQIMNAIPHYIDRGGPPPRFGNECSNGHLTEITSLSKQREEHFNDPATEQFYKHNQ